MTDEELFLRMRASRNMDLSDWPDAPLPIDITPISVRPYLMLIALQSLAIIGLAARAIFG